MTPRKFELRGRCPVCGTVRIIQGVTLDPSDPAAADWVESRITAARAVSACCKRVEDVAFFADGSRMEPWKNADEWERENGPDAGPLPDKPWDRLRDN